MCWMYARMVENADANHYAYPLDIVAEVSEELRVTKVYRLPTGSHPSQSSASTTERNAEIERPETFDPRKIHTSSEYHPTLRPSSRTSTKPLQIIQPLGPSFTIPSTDPWKVEWEKWRMM